MVGRCIPYWNSPFSGDMLVFWGVGISLLTYCIDRNNYCKSFSSSYFPLVFFLFVVRLRLRHKPHVSWTLPPTQSLWETFITYTSWTFHSRGFTSGKNLQNLTKVSLFLCCIGIFPKPQVANAAFPQKRHERNFIQAQWVLESDFMGI